MPGWLAEVSGSRPVVGLAPREESTCGLVLLAGSPNRFPGDYCGYGAGKKSMLFDFAPDEDKEPLGSGMMSSKTCVVHSPLVCVLRRPPCRMATGPPSCTRASDKLFRPATRILYALQPLCSGVSVESVKPSGACSKQ